jgi:pectate lyase
MQYNLILVASMALGVVASPAPQITQAPKLEARATMPKSSGSSVLKAVKTIAAGQTFDGGMKMYDRGQKCTGQDEGGDSDAVFILEKGATLSNVIIGPNQIEGVHCNGACTLNNVWWSSVCEDAFTIKKQAEGETTKIKGGGAFGAEDKVLQHNGGGALSVSGFTVDDFGKLYRSCGNCKSQYKRTLTLDSITASNGKVLAGKQLTLLSPFYITR